MSLKDLFSKPGSAYQASSLGGEECVESTEFVQEAVEDRTRFIPDVDYRVPENFVRYGLAEEYYKRAFSDIRETYPYDGSLKQKTEWRNHNPEINVFFYDQVYPKSTGYGTFSAEGYGNIATDGSSLSLLLSEPEDKEYIYFTGGPHSGTLFEDDGLRHSNLRFGGEEGSTVEFWMQKDTFPDLDEVILDVWPSGSASGSSEWGRFSIEVGDQGGTEYFTLIYQSGTSGHQYVTFYDPTLIDGEWHHYAFSVQNSGSSLEFKYYRDGRFVERQAAGSSISAVSGNLVGSIGAALSAPYSDYAATVSNVEGWGKLSASIDEVRYWKRARTSEQIAKNYFTNINGGADSDDSNADLGVYFKFNEGITGFPVHDSGVLDYSGRLTNGDWVGYTTSSRNTGSAMVSASVLISEEPDPILYADHPSYSSLLEEYTLKGRSFDYNNGMSLYRSMPAWIQDEDDGFGDLLKDFAQIVSVYFDSLSLQIEMVPQIHYATYQSQSYHNPVLAENLLSAYGMDAPRLFDESTVLELYADRNDKKKFENRVTDVKNTILQNLYTNLNFIYKSKGTEKAIRNTLRCFGIDEDLVRMNVYTNGEPRKITDTRRITSEPRKHLNFYDADNFGGVLTIDPGNTALSSSFISASLDRGFTLEASVRFPEKEEISSEFYLATPFVTSSVFGIASAVSGTNETNFAAGNEPNFQVFAVQTEKNSPHALFMLSSSMPGFPVLTSSIFYDVYEGQTWTLAVKKVEPDGASGTLGTRIVFQGASCQSDIVTNEFLLTGTWSDEFLTGTFRPYAGAYRSDVTGTLVHFSDAQIGAVRYWESELDERVVKRHALDPLNYGTQFPSDNASTLLSSNKTEEQSLTLHWDFSLLSSSDASGQLQVLDFSSGTSADFHRTGRAYGLASSASGSISPEYIISARPRLPDASSGLDEISIKDDATKRFDKTSRPTTRFYAFEKSMYASISDEMLRLFSSVIDYGSLIGQPRERYEVDYRSLRSLRESFFLKVVEDPDLERFTDFYKWIDGALSDVLYQLVPASVRISSEVRDVIESHILERSKYRRKLPTLKRKQEALLEAPMIGGAQLQYPWGNGHPPIPLTENTNCTWWKEKAPPVSSSAADVNLSKAAIKAALTSSYEQQRQRYYTLKESLQTSLQIGYNSTFDGGTAIAAISSYNNVTQSVSASSVGEQFTCTDDDALVEYLKLNYIVVES